MTPAELKTTREACGLSQAWLAQRAQVNERTVRYWESGRSTVPDDVATLVAGVDTMLDHAAAQAVEQARTMAAAHGTPDAIDLYRYSTDAELWAARADMQGLPATCHAALLARARRQLKAAGFVVRIHWM